MISKLRYLTANVQRYGRNRQTLGLFTYALGNQWCKAAKGRVCKDQRRKLDGKRQKAPKFPGLLLVQSSVGHQVQMVPFGKSPLSENLQ